MRLASAPLAEAYASLDDTGKGVPCRLEGRLQWEPRLEHSTYVLSLSVDRLTFAGGKSLAGGGAVRLLVPQTEGASRLAHLAAGDRIRLWARLSTTRGFLNPGRFDSGEHLARGETSLSGTVKSGLLVDRLAVAPLWSPASLASRARAFVRRRVEAGLAWTYGATGDGGEHRAPSPERRDETAGVLLAMLVGDRSDIPAWTERLYQEAGTFHVIAISGAHVALLALILYGGLRKAGLLERSALLLLLLAIPAYGLICGATPSVARATLMGLALVGARWLSLSASPANALAISGLLLLAVRPLDLGDPGFQLSFAATATIIGFTGPIAAQLRGRGGRLTQWIAVSLAAQLGVVPILAWHFQRVTPAAVGANLLAVPASAGLLVVGAALMAFQPVPGLGHLLSLAAYLLVKLLTWSSLAAISLPGGSLRVPPPGPLWMVAYFLALTEVLLTRGKRRGPGVALLVILFLSLVGRPESETPEDLTLSVVDVGHGDAILLEVPGGQRLLLDGGGSHHLATDRGESVVVPFLLHRGIKSLRAVVLTHPDRDHLGGLAAVVSNLQVGEVWVGPPAWELPAYRELRRRAAERGSRVRRLRESEEIALGPATVEVLASGGAVPPGKGRKTRGYNAQSLVLRVRYGSAAVLLTGDAEAELERFLVQSGLPLSADILKVGHHGSRNATSPLFLDAVRPRLAVISSGRSGAFRLPSPRVIQRLRDRGVVTYRTDRDGSISVSLSETGRIRVRTYNQPEQVELH
jgi:competence protein ComEC